MGERAGGRPAAGAAAPGAVPQERGSAPAAHINAHLDRCLPLHLAGLVPAQPRAKRRRPSESSALKQPATPTAAESSEGEAEEPDDGGESEDRESDDVPPTPSGARLLPDFPGARPGSPGGSGARGCGLVAVAAGGASPRSWGEAEALEEEEAAATRTARTTRAADAADAGAAASGPFPGRPRAGGRGAEGAGLPADTMRPDALQDPRTGPRRGASGNAAALAARGQRGPRSSCGGHRAAARSARRPGPLRGRWGSDQGPRGSAPPSPPGCCG